MLGGGDGMSEVYMLKRVGESTPPWGVLIRDAVIITLYKNKGKKSNCDNYRGITLLSIAGKILARILLNRLVPTIAEDNTPESQCGFRRNRSTTDSCKKNAGSKIKDSTFPSSTWPKHSTQWAEKECGRSWNDLAVPKVPQHGNSATWRPAWPSQAQQWPLRAFRNQQRRETGLRPGTDSLLHLLQHDAETGYWRPQWRW